MHSLASIEIDRPIDEVFAYTNDNVAEWSLTVVESEVIDDLQGVGTRFRCVTEERGRRMDFLGVITVWEPPTKSAISLTGKSFDIEAEYRFDDLNGRTRVTQESTVTGKGFVRIMFFLFGWLMNKQGCDAVRKELQSLKEKLESGHVTIPRS
ncbi:SRPBCC family protein [Roseimaritima ulvae]|uniref:Polyketide cyclase / dehydrase and lipid transport n=1 Tax=Roseimaritima ulvae TaxID=980254 RepID=A0A5B9QL60_9BACT|nr:SRPBCC family protein [Roseimaritima ulvae]QEG38512.1 Polyketide cyclase / dehydrase and lipid transport [Roseimaritima ulvae]